MIITNVITIFSQTTSRQDIPNRLVAQSTQNQQSCAVVNHQTTIADNQQNREKLHLKDVSKMVPPFKDFHNNLHTYQYLQQLENLDNVHPRHNEITQQYSSSTDEGCETDHGGKHFKSFNLIMSKFG